MSTSTEVIQDLANQEYKYGFVTDIEQESVPPGLNEDVIRLISAKKHEPEWLLEWRLKAYRHWLTMTEPTWANVHYPPIDYQAIVYYSAPKSKTVAHEPRRGRSGAAEDVRQARHSARRAEAARGRGGRRRVRQRLGGDDVQGEARRARDHLLLVLRGGAAPSGAGPQVSRLGRAVFRQLLRDAQLGGLHRRLVRVHPEGRALPDGALDLLPHQRAQHGAVRADADRGRGRART